MSRMCFMACVVLGTVAAMAEAGQQEYRVAETLEVGKTFAGTPLPPGLLTHDTIQYVAFYDENQQVTLAQRHLGETQWTYRKLPLNARWNNHVKINQLIVDKDGLLHFSGNSQIYNARLETGQWQIYQTSDWAWRWGFGGGGAIPSHVGAGSVRATEDGFLSQSFRNAHYGNGVWKLDPETLKPLGMLPSREIAFPRELQQPTIDFTHQNGSRMGVIWAMDRGVSKAGEIYALRKESLPVNRDQPRGGAIPGPSMLVLYRLVEGEQE